MKKSILFLLMIVFVSTNLYAEELHYHKEMWCLKPDGTPKGIKKFDEDGYGRIKNKEGGDNGYDNYQKESLQTLYTQRAIEYGITTQIPSKKTQYDSEKIAGSVTVEPISNTQIYMSIWQDGGEDHILMTYNPATNIIHETVCVSIP